MEWPFGRGTTLFRGRVNHAYYHLLTRIILQVVVPPVVRLIEGLGKATFQHQSPQTEVAILAKIRAATPNRKVFHVG